MESFLHSAFQNHVLTITIDHPKANALNTAVVAALQQEIKKASRDEAVRVVVLTGSGHIFSAGQDLGEFQQARGTSISYREHLAKTYTPLVIALRQLEKPVIAAINGPIAGAALGIALACDLRIAAQSARFLVGFLGIGLAPDSGISLFLPQVLGLGRATEYAFTNQTISAAQALDWGLINRLVPDAEFPQAAQAWAEELAHGPIRAMGLAKRTFNHAFMPQLIEALDYEGHIQDIAGRSAEHREGVDAFFQKRPPNFLNLNE
ncbi:MAG: 2-(1,2-epoxy-1,2-dihydrophenyl)acetyl-CoA isomerase PaaG [Anaerolineales bacterium]